MKIAIIGQPNSGKTTLMESYLCEYSQFILLDTTCMENKSIMNRKPELFNKIYRIHNSDDINVIFLMRIK